MTRISRQGRRVLGALVTGPLSVAAVLTRSARLARRYWWRARVCRGRCGGCGRQDSSSLVTAHPTRPTLTDQAAFWRVRYATVQASPETAYQAYRRQFPTRAEDYESVAAYAAWRSRRRAARRFARHPTVNYPLTIHARALRRAAAPSHPPAGTARPKP